MIVTALDLLLVEASYAGVVEGCARDRCRARRAARRVPSTDAGPSRSVSDLAAVCSLELIALRTFQFSGYPAIFEDADILCTWSQVGSVILAAAAFAAGAFALRLRVRPDRRTSALLLGLPLVVGAVAIAEAAAMPEHPAPARAGRRRARVNCVAPAYRQRPVRTGGGRATIRAERSGDSRCVVAIATPPLGRLNPLRLRLPRDNRVYMGDVLRRLQ